LLTAPQTTCLLRALQLALVSTLDTTLAMLGLMCVDLTAFVSIVFNHRAFAVRARRPPGPPAAQLTSVDWLLSRDPAMKAAQPRGGTGEQIELGGVGVETQIELRKD
jgi:hypothetical protein